jgi:hypothetical protein
MISHKVNATQEKTKIFPIINNLSPPIKQEYSLQHSFFDPCNSSPPNDFMLKLEKRLKTYDLGIKCNNDSNVYLIK